MTREVLKLPTEIDVVNVGLPLPTRAGPPFRSTGGFQPAATRSSSPRYGGCRAR